MQTRTTLSELSKALNLSISTVSKSLSDSPEISDKTKDKVKAFAKECNYIPNSFAASFRKGCTNTIGLVIPNVRNPFYANVLAGIEDYLDQHGYRLITSISNESVDKESNSLKKMAEGYVDALIICPSKETELKRQYDHINALIGQGTPVVMFDRICEELHCDKVIINDYKSSYETTEYLIQEKQCKHIIMVSLIDNLQHGKLRADGFKNAMRTNHLNCENTSIVANTEEELKVKLSKVLVENKSIDGVFCVNGRAVAQAMHTIRDIKSKDANRDITLAGFCNQMQADYDPSLIVVNQNAEKIGQESAKIILKRIKKAEKKSFFTKTVAACFL